MNNNNIEKETIKMTSNNEADVMEQSAQSDEKPIVASANGLQVSVDHQAIAMKKYPLETIDPVSGMIQQPAVSVKRVPGMDDMVPAEVRASSDSVSENIKGYENQGLFNPTIGMGQIIGRCQDKLYACISKNSDNCREVRFIEKYADGSYSPEFAIQQSDLIMAAMALKYDDEQTKKESQKSFRRIRTDFLNKCCRQETQDIREIILALADGLSKLPVISESGELTPAQLYETVIDSIRTECPVVFECYRREGYIMLMDYHLEMIAEKMSMSVRELLKRLKKNQLLYLTDSCKGYQARVPDCLKEGKVVYEWYYCLRDMEYYSRKLDPKRADSAKNLATSFLEELESV